MTAEPTTDDPEALITPDAMARRLHVSVRTLRKWVTAGQIPYHRVGRKTMFDADDYRAILAMTARAAIGPDE